MTHTNEYMRAYYAKNKDRINAQARRRNARRRMTDFDFVERQREHARRSHRVKAALRKQETHAPRACLWCESVFTPAHRSDQVYCSRVCQKRAGREKGRAEKNRRAREAYVPAKLRMPMKSCVGCGLNFIPRVRRDQRYCSRRCGERDVLRVYGAHLHRRRSPPALVAIAEAIKETKTLLKTLEGPR